MAFSRHSAIYEGRVRHRRRTPRVHAFSFPLFMMYLDLDELPRLFDGRWLWSVRRPAAVTFRRRDYLGDPEVPLAEAVRDLVEERSGRRPEGPVRLLTHLRTFGHQFNPVSFYYAFSAAGRLEHVVTEITNTPWNERYSYVLSLPEAPSKDAAVPTFHLQKDFHVSPFMGMAVDYAWKFSPPGARLVVHMENHEAGVKTFDATLALKRREISGPALAGVLCRYPLMTVQVVAAIYFQAGRLWWKRLPFYPHPKKRAVSTTSREDLLRGGNDR